MSMLLSLVVCIEVSGKAVVCVLWCSRSKDDVQKALQVSGGRFVLEKGLWVWRVPLLQVLLLRCIKRFCYSRTLYCVEYFRVGRSGVQGTRLSVA